MDDSFERAYYESPAVWAPEHYLGHDAERTRLAAQWLPAGIDSLLDVGCGNGLLVNQLAWLRGVVGLDRSLAALGYVQVPCCQADAAALPFPDGAFDVVVSMEVIEHLPPALYRPALAELARVARCHLLITVPYREDLDGSRVTCPQCGCCFHRYYHARRFDSPDLQRLFQEWGMALARSGGIAPVRVLLFSRLRRGLGRILHGRPPFPNLTVCPQCGYSRHEAPGQGRVEERAREKSGAWLWRLWPRRKSYLWWIALYERRQVVKCEL
jgi:SAM-dependent methyltransferase